MGQTIVQINFSLNVSGAEYEQAVAPLAQPMADLAGLQWKIWLLNDEAHTAGGIYLFADADSARAFLDGPMIAQVKVAPILGNFSARLYGVAGELSAITRAPLGEAVRAA